MRSRNIKPNFFKNELLGEMPYETRLLFIGLWCLADCEGRLEDRSKRIEAEIFPYEKIAVEKHLHLLASARPCFIVRYEVNSKRYIQIVNFSKHQSPNPHEKRSEIPPTNDDAYASNCNASAKNSNAPLNPSSLNPESPIPLTKRVFVRPTAEEVRLYGASIGFRLDGSSFWDFYESKGWKIGNSPMKSWQAAVRNWKRREVKDAVAVKTPALPPPKVYDDIPDSERMTQDEMKKIREMAMGGLNARAKSI